MCEMTISSSIFADLGVFQRHYCEHISTKIYGVTPHRLMLNMEKALLSTYSVYTTPRKIGLDGGQVSVDSELS
jgi:hypothetical protein